MTMCGITMDNAAVISLVLIYYTNNILLCYVTKKIKLLNCCTIM